MFKDRIEAGQQLAEALDEYKEQSDTIVLAIPRGGIILGVEIADVLNIGFSILISRKLPLPSNPESGFGALAEDGNLYLHPQARLWVTEEQIDEIIERQKKVIKERIETLRENKSLPSLEEKTVILVDDGIAMGSTMEAAIRMCRLKRVKKIVVAVPVASPRAMHRFYDLSDDLIVLESPPDFRAVAEVYQNWWDVSDHEALQAMKKIKPEK
jgi:predicted phosphoribosyltransferase